MNQNTQNYNSFTYIFIVFAFLSVRVFSVTICALVGGVGLTHNLTHPTPTVSLGN